MTEQLQILHNTGVFDYQKLRLALFGLECVGLIVAALAIGWAGVHLLFVRRQRKPSRVWVVALAVAAAAYGAFALPKIASKTCFARGYGHYLDGEASTAAQWYLRALYCDRSFEHPLAGLVEICSQLPPGDPLIGRVAAQARGSRQPEILAAMARLTGRAGLHAEAAELYAQAHRLSGQDAYWVGRLGQLIAADKVALARAEIAARSTGRTDGSRDGEFHHLLSLLDLKDGRLVEAQTAIEQALAAEPANSWYYVTKGEILFKVGAEREAVAAMARALSLRPDLPAAYHAVGLHYYRNHDRERASEFLAKAVYYDNQDSVAGILYDELRRGNASPADHLRRNRTFAVLRNTIPPVLSGTVGGTFETTLEFTGVPENAELRIAAFEPFGFGVEAELGDAGPLPTAADPSVRRVRLQIRALRPDRVNLNEPWVVNVVLWDPRSGEYTDHCVRVAVVDRPGAEGRVLFVITEDLEQTSGSGQPVGAPGVAHISPREARIDLIDKPALAHQLAEKHRVKWSHIVDIGSAILRLQWAQQQSTNAEWKELWPAMHESLVRGLATGNDVQLHIHGYNVPGNRLSRLIFDTDNQIIRFAGNMSRLAQPDGTNGAWADNFGAFGDWNDENTRVGSIFRGIRLLEGEFHESQPDYRVLFFRAGEYEFGRDRSAVTASIAALRLNQILAGSDAHRGDPFRRDFRFFRPPTQNVYFSSSGSIADHAASLLDIGILQILPVPEHLGHDHLSPVSSPASVRGNYERCLKVGAVKPGVHVLLEMYHLNTANLRTQWDNLDPQFGDWRRMEEQFTKLAGSCPKLEYATITQAVEACLDDLAPDLIAVRANERRVAPREYRYDIRFLGRDIVPRADRPHFVAVKPPSFLVGRIQQLEIRQDDRVVAVWDNVSDYRDLPLPVTASSGYTMRVFLKD